MMLNNLLRKYSSGSSSQDSFAFPGFIKKLKILPKSIESKSKKSLSSSLYTTFPKLQKTIQPSKPCQNSPNVPKISAESWIVYDISTRLPIIGSQQYAKREIASITKVMTCVIAIEEMARLNGKLDEVVEISFCAANVQGTNAGLGFRDQIKIVDLLFALMLPSGNDAAVALSEHFGRRLQGSGTDVEKFIKKMNEKAQVLGMKDTHFQNPHGMSTSLNISTAFDVAILCQYALKIPFFRKIVNCEKYYCEISFGKGTKKLCWGNTNKLLKEGFIGVKTGFTPAAGPCLACAIGNIVIVLLGCKYRRERWKDAIELLEWTKGIKKLFE